MTDNTMTDEAIEVDSIKVCVRNNFGVDTDYDVSSSDEAQKIITENANPKNHMIRLFYDGVCDQRWDRDRVKDKNRWSPVDPDEIQILGVVVELSLS